MQIEIITSTITVTPIHIEASIEPEKNIYENMYFMIPFGVYYICTCIRTYVYIYVPALRGQVLSCYQNTEVGRVGSH